VDRWHNDQVPGRLQDALGLTPREYQAWTTGGVSLLTIARWRTEGPPPLDADKPWFKLTGRPPHERVGYLEEKTESEKRNRRHVPHIGGAGRTNSKGRRSSRPRR